MGNGLYRGLLIWAGILTACSPANPHRPPPQSNFRNDPRLVRLAEFFRNAGSPLAPLAEDFLSAADRYHLDWRLLPSISMVESGGGRRFAWNNVFGWGSGKLAFSSIRAGIHTVAARLANSRLYKDKELRSVLGTYNPHPGYAALVQSVMKRIEPGQPPRARSKTPTVVYSNRRTA
jgi:hypothetical protein